MRFSMLITGIFAAATYVLATPIQSVDVVHGFAGNVLDSNGKAYMLKSTEPGNVKVIADRINGEWMRPVSFFVEQGYFCKFYQEATRGVDSLIGGFTGPLFHFFDQNDWAVFYECYESIQACPNATTTAADDSGLRARNSMMIPCGFVQTADGGRASLKEGRQGQMSDFAFNGELYTPFGYHVSSGCNCRFYSARTVRGGAEMITAAEGPSDGHFGEPAAARYQCWLRV